MILNMISLSRMALRFSGLRLQNGSSEMRRKRRGIECVRMELVDVEAGRKRPVPIEGSEFIIEVDAVIKAIGKRGMFR